MTRQSPARADRGGAGLSGAGHPWTRPDSEIDTSDIPELDAAFFERDHKKQLTMRLDQDVVDWFKSQGTGYQTRMNAVLRAFYERSPVSEPKPSSEPTDVAERASLRHG